MGDFYTKADTILSDIKKQRKNYENTVYTANALPSTLKQKFKEKGDKGLDEAITKAENKTLGGAIEGLDKFQNIANPFTRRNLAEKYQQSLSRTQQSLYGERERRQGNITDYINAWAGTYGAQALAEQTALQGMEQDFSMEMQLGGKRESAANRASDKIKDPNTIQMINMGVNEGLNWEEISKGLADAGINVGRGGEADEELRRVFGEKTAAQEDAESELKREIDKENSGKYQDFLDDIATGKLDDDVQVTPEGHIGVFHEGFLWGKDRWEIIMRNPNI